MDSVSTERSRNWLELPPDVTATILKKIGVIDILKNARGVCTSWRTICHDPSMWRSIDLKLDYDFLFNPQIDAVELAKHAVDRSCGQLIDLTVGYFATDDFIRYLAQSSTQLRRLQILYCRFLSDEVIKETASMFPMLEELTINSTPFSVAAVEAIGKFCPQLKMFKCNCSAYTPFQAQDDELADIISRAMPHLRHLQILRTKITNSGLKAILNGCPCLETLDMRGCYLINPKVDNLDAVCSARYKRVRFPAELIEYDELEDAVLAGFGYSDYDDSFFDELASDLEYPGHLDEPYDFDDMFYDDDGVDYDDIFDYEDGEMDHYGEEAGIEEEEEHEEELEVDEVVEVRIEEQEKVLQSANEEETKMRIEEDEGGLEMSIKEYYEEVNMGIEEEEEFESKLEEDEEELDSDFE